MGEREVTTPEHGTGKLCPELMSIMGKTCSTWAEVGGWHLFPSCPLHPHNEASFSLLRGQVINRTRCG